MTDPVILGILALLNLFLGVTVESRLNLIVGAILALMFVIRII